ncbi:hypothetical protein PLESTB_000445000 [Pleodorina starrii]|uniref:Ribosomal protein L46 N-terminal domain-containing protein n=1 Tax=Pleodorina starrii TaxID=330485 RepID=A0A9W6BFP6_9CHLO|nr:hypothetical protein PLESTM_000675800 [Pleodorina starrii]GLC50903.1 hypothetical protein PLESTB_000445000 [Pleodorina starrii]GLC73904.1 hypothetical protein PLESTF_001435700 [Pleodorina starrii]
MRCSQVLETLRRSIVTTSGSSSCWQAARAYASPSAEAASATATTAAASDGEDVPVFAACVLQRLPLLRPQLAPHHGQHLIWSRQRGLETGELKDYPEAATRGRGDAGSKQEKQDLRTFSPVPSETIADSSGDVRSMRRRLSEGLYLVVRSGGQQGQGAAPGPASTAAPPQGAADRGGGGGGGVWGFPSAAHTGEESISDTAQRALHSVIGRSHPVFFVGRAPMAHLAARTKGKTFFMLAQTVDDPWDMRLVEGAPAQDYAWATKQELLSSYLTDARTRELVSKML